MNTIDHAEARELTGQIGQLEGEIDLLTFEHFTAVRELCTPEQKVNQAAAEEINLRSPKQLSNLLQLTLLVSFCIKRYLIIMMFRRNA